MVVAQLMLPELEIFQQSLHRSMYEVGLVRLPCNPRAWRLSCRPAAPQSCEVTTLSWLPGDLPGSQALLAKAQPAHCEVRQAKPRCFFDSSEQVQGQPIRKTFSPQGAVLSV